MTLKLNGSSSGHVNLDAKAAAASNTLTLPDTANGELVAADSSGHINLADDKEIKLGTGGDLKIYHKSSDNGNYIECENSRTLYYQSDNHFMLDEAGNEYIIKGIANGAVELYHNNTKTVETLAAGAKVNVATAATAEFGIQAASSQNAELWLLSDAGNQYGDKVRLLQDDGTLSIDFYTASNTWTTASKFTSSGYVTTPLNPGFHYKQYDNASTNAAMNAAGVVLLSVNLHNIGNNYDTSNGRFTAPVAGTYFFYFNALIDNNTATGHHYIVLQKNGSGYTTLCYTRHNFATSNGEYTGMSGSAVINLAVSDYVTFYSSGGIHNGGETNGGGFLLG